MTYSNAFFLCSHVLAPTPPLWLLEHATELMKNKAPTQAFLNNWDDELTARTLYKNGTKYKNAFNHSSFLDDRSLDWAKKEITNATKDIRINFYSSWLRKIRSPC